MPNRALRECNKSGCTNLTRKGYCDDHQYILEEQKKRRNEHYNRIRDDKKEQQFYKTSGWQKVRQKALVRDNYLCQMCKSESKIVAAETVHHKVELKKDWSKRLNLSNLVSLCNACHNNIHKGKHKES